MTRRASADRAGTAGLWLPAGSAFLLALAGTVTLLAAPSAPVAGLHPGLVPGLAVAAVLAAGMAWLAAARVLPLPAVAAGSASPLRVRAGHLPDGGPVRQADPDAPGRPRPRAPGAVPGR